jgi:hypothetical protein
VGVVFNRIASVRTGFACFAGVAWIDPRYPTESVDPGAMLLPQYTKMKIQIQVTFDPAVQQADVESKHTKQQ